MEIRQLSPFISVSPQLQPSDIGLLAGKGFRAVICNRPDGESDDQPDEQSMREACERHGIEFAFLPVVPGQVEEQHIEAFDQLLKQLNGPVLAFCRTGTRSATLWALSMAPRLTVDAILVATQAAGYDLSAQQQRLEQRGQLASAPITSACRRHEVVIVGGGAGGQAVAASLLKRNSDLDIAIIEPSADHYYQPGWTLVGGGVFERSETVRPMAKVMQQDCKWYQTAVASFEPQQQQIVLEDGERIGYRALVVSPGLALDWDGIEGLKASLGSNGVTSNYQFDLAPYTWELIQGLRSGRALFTQPAMPIKCAGAPQKAMYLACDYWRRESRLKDIEVNFHTAGAVLFGVPDYVPALMKYIESYGIHLNYQQNLVAIDGQSKTAVFNAADESGASIQREVKFDMIHVCPPQRSPALISQSPLADQAGWLDLDPQTLQHKQYGDIFGLGDASGTPNAKTAAAVRKQAPTVAENVLMALEGQAPKAIYEGYGSCPLTVERGKIVLAEFGYGGKLQPSLPSWLIKGTEPSRLSWLLKEKLLPWIYWNGMLKGHEWLAKPELLQHRPTAHQASDACEFKDRR